MPPSEDEQRQLDQIERDLAQEPEFAWAPEQRRPVILAAVLLAVGMTLMLTGVTMHTAASLGAIISIAAMLAIVAALAVFWCSDLIRTAVRRGRRADLRRVRW